MKIKKTEGPGTTSGAGKTKKTDQQGSIDFRHLLQAQLEGVQDVGETAQVSKVEAREQGNPQLRLQGVQMTETTIDALDSFAKALQDAHLDVKDLEPFIAALEEDNQGLLDIKEQLAADDPLAQLIEQVAAACYLETSKYRRGDYND